MKELSLEEKVQRSLDYQEIQNVMAKHVFYYNRQRQREELETIWAQKTPDIVYAHNAIAFVGREEVKKYYAEHNEEMRKQKLEMASKLFPDVENVKENEGIGDLVVHPLTTPCIEIARDGKTARGLWYTTGLCSEMGRDGKPVATTIWEKAGVEFVKEDGKWKIWHFRGYGDLVMPMGESWADNLNRPIGRTVGEGPKPNRELTPYKNYSAKTVAQSEPSPPEPYETWDDSMSYIQ